MDSKIYVELGKRIRLERKAGGLTQDDLAKRVGLTRSSITNIEQGRQVIQVHVLYKFALALNVEPIDLLPDYRVFTNDGIEIEDDNHISNDEMNWIRSIKSKKL